MQIFAIDLAGPWYLDQVQTEVLRFGDNDGHVNESWEDFKQFWPLKNHVTRHDGMIGFNLGKVCSRMIQKTDPSKLQVPTDEKSNRVKKAESIRSNLSGTELTLSVK